jgi:hypothetical protein
MLRGGAAPRERRLRFALAPPQEAIHPTVMTSERET